MTDSVYLVFQKVWALYSAQLPFLIACAVMFTMLAMFERAASSPRKYWWRNPGLATDLSYILIHTLIGGYFRLPIMLLLAFLLSQTMSTAEITDYFTNGRGPLGSLPFFWQAVIYLVGTDFLLYWIHRGFHRGPMWVFHAIHHSAKQVDWTTSYRFHPINLMLQSSLVMGVMIFLGIRPEVIAVVVPFDAFIAVWQHSNSKWTFGPLKYVIATPIFHRWHHTLPHEGGDSNFAPTFAFWDYAFGTYYMPEGRLPENFGVDDPALEEGYFAQLAYPFKALLRDEAANAATPAPPAS